MDHLHRCKTSFCLVDGFGLCLLDFELCLQGGSARGMSFGFQFPLWIMLHLNLPQNFGVNRFQSTVRFSQSELLPISSDGTVAFSKDKERIHLHWFSCPVIHSLLSDFRGLFVHVRCIPHQ